ncbi:multidrug resistance-associated protein 1-like isoform X2 [Panonychus citri]|uniref:multidrug resistance-associated protein 1-like isoform X2 n=1 Tax=Panonychus citri TaxID=50023 RepID=UPI0023075165|nr:multidrug resistance-associated protein 1-like isoform X2 [Panonychus citri]
MNLNLNSIIQLESICGESILWDVNSTWNSDFPKLSRCFHTTILNWLPTCFLWLLCIYEIRRTIKIRRQLIPWNWINTCRLILSTLNILINGLQLVNIIFRYFNSSNPSVAADFYSSSTNIISFTLVSLLFHYHRLRGIHTSAIIWIYFFLQTICTFLIAYSTWVDSSEYTGTEVILMNIFFVSNLFLLIITSFADKAKPSTDEHELIVEKDNISSKKYSPENEASFLSVVFFWWFNKMAILGWRTSLTTKDLWELRDDLKTENLIGAFDTKLHQQVKVNIIPILIKVYGIYLMSGAFFKLVQDVLSFIIPQLLKLLISFIKNQSSEPIWHGFLIAFAMFIISFAQTVFVNRYFYSMYILGMRVTSTLTAAIYKKSLNLSDKANKEVTSGEVVNLMSVDAKRFLDLLPYLNLIWSAPLQILLSIWFLYIELGYSSLFGLGVMVLMMPINGATVHWCQKFQVKFMEQKDERVKFMNEILSGIKIIKFYAWENSFLKIVNELRKKELGHLRRLSYLENFSAFLWLCSPMMVSVATFAAYVLIQKESLTAEKAFVSLSLFHLLQFPLSMLPELLSYFVMTSISIRRINKFLSYEDLDPYVTRNNEVYEISIEDGYFKWNKKKQEDNKNRGKKNFFSRIKKDKLSTNLESLAKEIPTLQKINMKVKPGSFVAIVGSVGSGKSSLLSAILGEMEKISGRININGKYSIAYVAQQAWIQNTSLKNNILFGSPFDESKYNQVISACALEPDIAYLPGGDETEIGEKGINLSGGQKQRVSLARACYSDSNLFILDDPLSAVDAHVAQHIFKKVLSSKTGILKNKTRVLVTNKLDLLSKVDSIYVLTNGVITENGTYKQLMEAKGEFCDLVEQFTNQSVENDSELHEELGKSKSVDKKDDFKLPEEIQDDKTKLIENEESETGKVKWSVYFEYFGMVSILWTLLIVLSHGISNGFQLGSDIWLAKWSSDSTTQNVTLSSTEMRLGVYSFLGLMKGVLTLIGSFSLVNGTLRASIGFHRNLAHKVFRLPMSFFDTNPIGRIVNRFSKDIDVIDTGLPMVLNYWILCLFEVISACIIICINTPLFIITLVPITIIYIFIQRVYVSSSRQLKRLESVTRSPIYSHFGETLNGVSTIRAFNVSERFIQESAYKVDHNLSCLFPSIVANRWLSIRLELCGNLMILSTAIFAVLSRGSLDPGAVGLAVSYALSITGSLNWLVRMASDLETNIVAVERIMEYCKLKSEADWYEGKVMPPEDWPSKGSIKFDKYETRYREGTELILKGISGEIKGLEKIGIVGRTGAGKSTVTLSLFRLIEGSGGSISIDGLNISELPLHPLRSRLAIIPQDPVLFGGTLRFNLDPFDCYSDNDIWDALSHAHLKQFVNNTGQGLNYQIAEEGKNLSVGQRQLLCLARALLKKPKILFLDEATAAIDLETDSLIQKTIRTEFKDCTILTIAHRLNTILDSDRVMVLDQGQIAEFDEPQVLLENKQSIFYSLAKEANLVS